jgi:hypothetical protein
MHDLKRIGFLKSRLAEERRLALELVERFNQPPFKDKARRLADDADEISSTFLGRNLEKWRPEEAETILLDLRPEVTLTTGELLGLPGRGKNPVTAKAW